MLNRSQAKMNYVFKVFMNQCLKEVLSAWLIRKQLCHSPPNQILPLLAHVEIYFASKYFHRYQHYNEIWFLSPRLQLLEPKPSTCNPSCTHLLKLGANKQDSSRRSVLFSVSHGITAELFMSFSWKVSFGSKVLLLLHPVFGIWLPMIPLFLFSYI